MCEQLWEEMNDHCHVATFVCMSARFSHDEGYFHLHKIRYLKAVAETLIGIGDIFRIAIESITQLTDAEIVVRFKVQVRADHTSRVPNLKEADPVLAKMTVSALNPNLQTQGLELGVLDVTGVEICGNGTAVYNHHH